MSKKKLQPSQSYLIMFGAGALIIVRFLEKKFNEWERIDYYIGVIATGTIILSILILLKKRKSK